MIPDLQSPMDGSEITSFNAFQSADNGTHLKSPDENHFAVTPPTNTSPSNVYRSDDCNELLAKELAKLEENDLDDGTWNLVVVDKINFINYLYYLGGQSKGLVSQSSIEIVIDDNSANVDDVAPEYMGEVGV